MAIRIILILFIGFISSCRLIDQPEKIPSFIHIEDIAFSISNSLEGSQSEKITDAWVYVDGNLENSVTTSTDLFIQPSPIVFGHTNLNSYFHS